MNLQARHRSMPVPKSLEESIDRAVAAYPDPDAIVSRNLQTLRRLGTAGWRALAAAWRAG